MDENKNIEQKEKSAGVYTVNFAAAIQPTYVESKSGEYILNGKNHEYVKFLMSLQEVPLHRTINDMVARQIYGEGFMVDEEKSNVSAAQVDEINKWLTKYANPFLKKAAVDYSILSYCFMNVVKTKDKTGYIPMHIDASMVATGTINNETKRVEYHYTSNDFSKLNKKENEPIAYPAIDENVTTFSEDSALMMLKGYTMGQVSYSTPCWASAADYLQIAKSIGKFHLANIDNGMVPSMWVNFNNGKPANDEEEQLIYEEIKSAYGGASNAGKLIITFSKSKENAPEYQMLNSNDADKQFIMLRQEVTQEIILAHNAHPALFISTPGSLGQSAELMNASELFYNANIAPAQIMFEDAINLILKMNGYDDVKVIVKDTQPISFKLTPELISPDSPYTKDEQRQLLGLPPLSEDPKAKPLPVEILGVGGLTGLLTVLTSTLTDAQKLNSMQIIFGFTEEEAIKLIYGDANPAPSTNNTLTTDQNA